MPSTILFCLYFSSYSCFPGILFTSTPIFFPSHWLLFHITIIEKMDSHERGMNRSHWIISLIVGKNVGRACKLKQLSPVLNPVCYPLSYWAWHQPLGSTLTTMQRQSVQKAVLSWQSVGWFFLTEKFNFVHFAISGQINYYYFKCNQICMCIKISWEAKNEC